MIKKSTRKSECLSAELHRANQQMAEWKQQLELVLKVVAFVLRCKKYNKMFNNILNCAFYYIILKKNKV